MMTELRPVRRWATLALAATVLWGCGGDDSTGPDPEPTPGTGEPATLARHEWTEASAPKGSALGSAPAVIVKDEDGNPLRNVSVTFEVTAGGGSVTGATATTGTNGVATVGSWTLGPEAGTNRLQASIDDSEIDPVTFTATGTDELRKWTVMVYMAADNNLAAAGIFDIDEMEAAGADPNVQVVVQAEFNKTALAQYDCGPECFGRTNWNTFRYAVTNGGTDRTGPNGEAEDVGNRTMTDPADLEDFIRWSKENYPAERYALVLWNHGGGYVGLLQDETSSGSALMSIGDLPAALDGVGPIDILDFDMCLMAGYETLTQLAGRVGYAVFSEEVVPGEGNPYEELIDGLQANASADSRTVAAMFVDTFHASFQSNRASTTISAYDLAGFAAFETSLDALVETLNGDLATFRPQILAAATQSQKYTYPELTDIVDFLDNLKANTTDATLHGRIDAVKAQATGAFRVKTQARNGVDDQASDVTASTGLNIVLPTGQGDDQLGDSGPRSLASYQALLPTKAWTGFLTAWLTDQTTSDMTDQGENRFEAYLVWPEGIEADVDFWILEPNGNLYIPFLGTVTPNGTLTNDSEADGTSYEGYLTNRYVQNGEYRLYAHLYSTPSPTYELPYELAYRFGQTTDLEGLFAPDYPVLSQLTSVNDDDTPTWEEIDAEAYTDLRYMASLTIGAPTGAPRLARPSPDRGFAMAAPMTSASSRQITDAQLQTARKAAGRRPAARSPLSRQMVQQMPKLLRRLPLPSRAGSR